MSDDDEPLFLPSSGLQDEDVIDYQTCLGYLHEVELFFNCMHLRDNFMPSGDDVALALARINRTAVRVVVDDSQRQSSLRPAYQQQPQSSPWNLGDSQRLPSSSERQGAQPPSTPHRGGTVEKTPTLPTPAPASTPARASTPSTPRAPTPAPAAKKPTNRQAIAETRLENIIQRCEELTTMGQDRPALVLPSELLSLIVGRDANVLQGQKKGHSEQEDEAVVRFLRGYTHRELEDKNIQPDQRIRQWPPAWEGLPRHNSAVSDVLDGKISLAEELQRKIDDDGATLESLSARLDWMKSDAMSASTWINQVWLKMETIYLHDTYVQLGKGKNGRKRQGAIMDTFFEAWLPDNKKHLATLAQDADADHVEERKTLRSQFSKVFTESGRSRTRIYMLYMNFGPAIILDPFWTVSDCYHRASKTFDKLLPLLYDHVGRALDNPDDEQAPEHMLVSTHSITSQTLIHLAAYLGGYDFGRYVVNFLARNRSKAFPADELLPGLSKRLFSVE